MTQVLLRDMWSYPLRLRLKRIRTEMTRSLTLCSNTSCPASSNSVGSLSRMIRNALDDSFSPEVLAHFPHIPNKAQILVTASTNTNKQTASRSLSPTPR